MATPRQTFALFCGTGLEVRHLNLSVESASNLISRMKNGEDVVVELIGLGATGTPKQNKSQDWQKLYDKAHAAGLQAGNSHNPTPMIVEQHVNPLNDNSPVVQSWHVSGGVCGFAWVIVTPGTCSFAKWLVKNKLGSKHYYGGISIWVSEFGQSMECKEAYAHAFAKVLVEAGIKAYSGSRMD